MENKKKYYFLVNSLEGGGAERVILRVSGQLQKEADIHIITLKEEKFYDIPEGVIWKPLSKVGNNLLMFLLIPVFVVRLKKLMRDEGYEDGISFLEISNFVHILAKKDAKISFRISLDFFQGFIGNIYFFFIKFLYPRAGKIIVNSSENGDDLGKKLGIPSEKILTIHNPVDIASVEKSSQEDVTLPGNHEGKKKYVTVGRLVWQKHHEDIIRAFSDLKNAGKEDFIYYIIGDGDERTKLESLTKELGLTDSVHFLGAQKNVFAYLKKCDYFLYASEAEGFPNVLLEAIAVGLPIITTDFKTGAREVMYGEYSSVPLPHVGPNGLLMNYRSFQKEFVANYEKIATLKQEQIGLDGYRLEKIAGKFGEVIKV